MKCAEFAAMVHDLVRPGQPDPAVTAIARAHAEVCPACASRLAEAERLARLLREVSSESRSLSAPDDLESRLLEAFRAQIPPPARRPAHPRLAFRWPVVLAWSGSAAAAFILAFALLNRAPGRRPSPVARPVSVATATSPTPVPSGRQSAVPRPASPPVSANTSGARIASSFVPVPFSGGLAPGDSALIIRVQVPRSALAELGYPVDESQGSGLVQADLVVGEDGWPHAVRIVR